MINATALNVAKSPRRKPAKLTGVRLRGYQVEAHNEVIEHFEAGAKAVALALPTGAGKTQIMKCIAAGWVADPKRPEAKVAAPRQGFAVHEQVGGVRAAVPGGGRRRRVCVA